LTIVNFKKKRLKDENLILALLTTDTMIYKAQITRIHCQVALRRKYVDEE
jgi:hypothetical protein